MITKVRIIKENSVYRIQEHIEFLLIKYWRYAKKWIVDGWFMDGGYFEKRDFITEKKADDYVKHNYEVKVIKEYEISNLKELKL